MWPALAQTCVIAATDCYECDQLSPDVSSKRQPGGRSRPEHAAVHVRPEIVNYDIFIPYQLYAASTDYKPGPVELPE